MTCALLLESGDQLLLEDADAVLLEACVAVAQDTGGLRYGPVPRRPLRIRKKKRYYAIARCTFRYTIIVRHTIPVATSRHTARTTHTAHRHYTAKARTWTAMHRTGHVTRTAPHLTGRCRQLTPATPEEITERLRLLARSL